MNPPTPPLFKTVTAERLAQLEAIELNADLLAHYVNVFLNKEHPTPYDINKVVETRLHLSKFIGLKSENPVLVGMPHNPLASQLLAALLSVVYDNKGTWTMGVHGDTPAPKVVGEAIAEAAKQGVTS